MRLVWSYRMTQPALFLDPIQRRAQKPERKGIYEAVQFLRSCKVRVYRISGAQHRVGNKIVSSRMLIALADNRRDK